MVVRVRAGFGEIRLYLAVSFAIGFSEDINQVLNVLAQDPTDQFQDFFINEGISVEMPDQVPGTLS